MLLKNKFILLCFILIFVIAPFGYAQTCKVSQIRDSLRKVLFQYFENPSASKVELGKIKDLLNFYFSIPSGTTNIDCSGVGSNSGTIYYNIVDEASNTTTTTVIPSCSDRSEYGTCSATKPYYCYNGKLISRCSACGCPSGELCSNNLCTKTVQNVTQNITCYVNSDCGNNGYTGNYFCENNDVYINNKIFSCVNPRTTTSYCSSNITAVIIDDCITNEQCIAGQATCQTVINQTNATQPTNQTQTNITYVAYGDCSWNTFDNVCPAACPNMFFSVKASDADCCVATGWYWLETSILYGYGCYDKPYNPGCSPKQECLWTEDNCCPNWCAAGSDADCCKQIGYYVLQTPDGIGCYDKTYNPGCSPGQACSGTGPDAAGEDGCCANWCAAGTDADCCKQKGWYWQQTSWGYGCYETPLPPGCSPGQACSNAVDNCCPSSCSVGVDADCCTNAGKYWLQTSWGYGCYDKTYNPGCGPGQACINTGLDNCCPNWCAAGSDADCCANVGKCFFNGQCNLKACSYVADNCCTYQCSNATDIDCCTKAGKCWVSNKCSICG